MKGKQMNIRGRVDPAVAERVAINRRQSQAIIKTLLLCGHQNIPLRGPRDSGKDVMEDNTAYHGNFWGYLNAE